MLRLARLAVDESARGRGIGKSLLRFVIRAAQEMAERVGCVGVVVDAKPESKTFYEGLGFEAMKTIQGALGERPEPVPMFLPLGSIPSR